MRIGVISDTHGLLRPQVFGAFEGVDHILHAGDVGSTDILDSLEAIAPVTAVFGNTDLSEVRARVGEVAHVELDGLPIVVLHGHLLPTATAEQVAAAHPEAALAVFGHSHRPGIREVGGVLTVNPGSAGPRRFRDPVTVAIVEIAEGTVRAELVQLLD
jgi:uncharacterized protein